VAAQAEDLADREPRPAESEAAPILDPTVTSVPVGVPETELTPEQQEIKMLRDLLAKKQGREDPEPEVDENIVEGDESNILVHFLEDGLTVNGRVMYRGDELEFAVGGQAYKDTFNRFGVTWLDLRDSDFAQVERFGKVMFRSGAWPGKTYADGTWEAMKAERGDGRLRPPPEEEIARAEKLRLKRAAPKLTALV
jgi:hypothetical protein